MIYLAKEESLQLKKPAQRFILEVKGERAQLRVDAAEPDKSQHAARAEAMLCKMDKVKALREQYNMLDKVLVALGYWARAQEDISALHAKHEARPTRKELAPANPPPTSARPPPS